jgi:hypothetical protein
MCSRNVQVNQWFATVPSVRCRKSIAMRSERLSKLLCKYFLSAKSTGTLPVVPCKLLLAYVERECHQLSVQQWLLWTQW